MNILLHAYGHTHTLTWAHAHVCDCYVYPKGKLSGFQYNMSNLHKYKVSIHIINHFDHHYSHIFGLLSPFPQIRPHTKTQ